jgi:hypothetical protein
MEQFLQFTAISRHQTEIWFSIRKAELVKNAYRFS